MVEEDNEKERIGAEINKDVKRSFKALVSKKGLSMSKVFTDIMKSWIKNNK